MQNELEVVQKLLYFARESEKLRKVTKFSVQRLEGDAWGVFVEGVTREGEVSGTRLRIEADGTMFRV